MSSEDTQAAPSVDETPAAETPAPEPAAKETKKAPARRDRQPDDVELTFSGDPNLALQGTPARDLTQADVDRLATRRTIPGPGERGLRRGEAGFSEARAKVVRELTATGKFTKRS